MQAIILAAGLSRRIQKQKLTLPFAGSTILETVVRNVVSVPFDEVILVTSRETREQIEISAEAIKVVINENPAEGQSSSLRLGVMHLLPGEDFCVLLGDMPFVTTGEIAEYRAIFEGRNAPFSVLVSCRDLRFGHPIFFSSVWKDRLLFTEGDIGGRRMLEKFPEEVLRVYGEDSFFVDIDTPEDYSKMTQFQRERL